MSEKVDLARSVEGDDDDLVLSIEKAQDKAIKAGCEGIIVKSRDARYETNGTRVNTWIKLKNVNLQSNTGDSGGPENQVRDTLDLVPIGGYFGKGSRTGLYGSYLMAAYSSRLRRFYTVCKLGTGFTKE